MEYKLLVYVILGVALSLPHAMAQLDYDLHRALQLRASSSVETYCGNTLSSKLSLVCKGRYNTLQKLPPIAYQKRDITSKRYYKQTIPEPAEFPLLSREEANTFIRDRRRIRRGIADECCKKPCTLEEIQSFCID